MTDYQAVDKIQDGSAFPPPAGQYSLRHQRGRRPSRPLRGQKLSIDSRRGPGAAGPVVPDTGSTANRVDAAAGVRAGQLFVSVITIHELEHGFCSPSGSMPSEAKSSVHGSTRA
jgi:hypothetical protein